MSGRKPTAEGADSLGPRTVIEHLLNNDAAFHALQAILGSYAVVCGDGEKRCEGKVVSPKFCQRKHP